MSGNLDWVLWLVIPLSIITLIWFSLFGLSKYIDTATCQANSNNKKDKVITYKVSYIWWLRNLLPYKQLNYQKHRTDCSSNSLISTVYLPKLSHNLLVTNEIIKRILGQPIKQINQVQTVPFFSVLNLIMIFTILFLISFVAKYHCSIPDISSPIRHRKILQVSSRRERV